jgi:hypothetical protein
VTISADRITAAIVAFDASGIDEYRATEESSLGLCARIPHPSLSFLDIRILAETRDGNHSTVSNPRLCFIFPFLLRKCPSDFIRTASCLSCVGNFEQGLPESGLLGVRESRWPAYRGYSASRGFDSSNRTPRPTPQRSLSEGNCDGVNMIVGGSPAPRVGCHEGLVDHALDGPDVSAWPAQTRVGQYYHWPSPGRAPPPKE